MAAVAIAAMVPFQIASSTKINNYYYCAHRPRYGKKVSEWKKLLTNWTPNTVYHLLIRIRGANESKQREKLACLSLAVSFERAHTYYSLDEHAIFRLKRHGAEGIANVQKKHIERKCLDLQPNCGGKEMRKVEEKKTIATTASAMVTVLLS